MLRRMYMKWANKKNCKIEIISEHKGDEAGIKSSIIKISGDYINGLLKNESGIHRLVESLHLTLDLEDIQVLQVFGFIPLYLMT